MERIRLANKSRLLKHSCRSKTSPVRPELLVVSKFLDIVFRRARMIRPSSKN